MDDTTQNPVSGTPQQPIRQPIQVPSQPVASSGGPKEAPKMPAISSEWVSSSTPEVVLPKEVKDAGVETQPVMPVVGPSAKQAGVAMAKEAVETKPVAVEPLGMNTPTSVLQQLKQVHKSVKDSLTWLVRLIIKEQAKKEEK